MVLLGLLFLPVVLGLVGHLTSRGRVTVKEFLVHEAIVVGLITAAYYVALHYKSADIELWNGVIATKTQDREQCCHSYPCDCHQVCSGSGKSRSCHTSCDTCYHHGPRKFGTNGDIGWNATTSNGERAYHDGCNAPGSGPPARWSAVVIGEPTAIEHDYQNYIKGNPDSVLRRQGAAERYVGRLPDYPRVYDWYRANRFLGIGVSIPNLAQLNARLMEINSRVGPRKHANVVVVVVRESDPSYLEGLRETWLGGKQNDIVVVVGAPEFPKISWAGAISWTKNELIKIELRDRLVALGTFDGNRVLDIVDQEVLAQFVHRPISDFEYLKETIEPAEEVSWWIFAIGLLLAIVLQVWFWHKDPFGDGHAPYHFRYGRNGWR